MYRRWCPLYNCLFKLINEEHKEYSPGASWVLAENFSQLMTLLIRITKQRHYQTNSEVHRYLLPLIPKLAAFNPKKFEEHILHDVISYCIGEIHRKEHRNSSLLTLGLVVYLVSKNGSTVFSNKNYLQDIINCFKDVIQDEGGLIEDQRGPKKPVNHFLFKSLNLITVKSPYFII